MRLFALSTCFVSSLAIAVLPSWNEAHASMLLTSPQQAQLKQLGIRVILPTYLPTGFKLAQITMGKKQNPHDPMDISYYMISYLGPNNTCIETGSGYQGMLIENPKTSQLKTKLGLVEIASGQYRASQVIQRWARFVEGDQAIITGGTGSDEQNCQPVSVEEFNKVLKSATVLQ